MACVHKLLYAYASCCPETLIYVLLCFLYSFHMEYSYYDPPCTVYSFESLFYMLVVGLPLTCLNYGLFPFLCLNAMNTHSHVHALMSQVLWCDEVGKVSHAFTCTCICFNVILFSFDEHDIVVGISICVFLMLSIWSFYATMFMFLP